MKPQHLTVKKVKKAALAAFKARKLTAQHRDPEKRECHYEEGVYSCAIGAALSKKTMKRIRDTNHNESSLCAIVNAGIVTCDDIQGLDSIQSAHDSWAGAAKENNDPEWINSRRKQFLERIKA